MAEDRVELFVDKSQEWRWRRKAANGEVVSTSGEGFVSKQYALESAKRYNNDLNDFEYLEDARD